ncbi:EexN family lipoprotein [Xanthomonas vasicola]|uniref:Conjugal transfer protein TraG n=1 Tax=Xanthomonas vasicola pv. vasculorum NCPPB 890 TaxID=1184265 RepID=A0A836ZU25_XANVA|nr:EexN family lipoprotein [Xanthomonas vasicola]KFA30048.1 conjugal transfer protein TraG [Xanthomonas vasicola pv. vasculorum NCPPB 1326]KFA32188.1 conjugal transfer protein TraG [Xanthomonas vasicola pv. vasculorum NCPPB 1381]MBV6748230.1 EexN family lipoprotein [Xanthomonas vasicola pv. vasculorum NCPPB 890]MBV6893867.1 EexN family lipoprotein [Xanthomonas vasicola pv. vasculorum]MDO6949562.1 EexN family lipoprotein [Xanthomonas vasicola]
MKRVAYTTLLTFVAALSGCKDEQPVQTVAWYKEHAPERATMLADCRANAGQAAASANCINAEKADAETETAKRGHLQLDAGEFGKELKGSK